MLGEKTLISFRNGNKKNSTRERNRNLRTNLSSFTGVDTTLMNCAAITGILMIFLDFKSTRFVPEPGWQIQLVFFVTWTFFLCLNDSLHKIKKAHQSFISKISIFFSSNVVLSSFFFFFQLIPKKRFLSFSTNGIGLDVTIYTALTLPHGFQMTFSMSKLSLAFVFSCDWFFFRGVELHKSVRIVADKLCVSQMIFSEHKFLLRWLFFYYMGVFFCFVLWIRFWLKKGTTLHFLTLRCFSGKPTVQKLSFNDKGIARKNLSDSLNSIYLISSK